MHNHTINFERAIYPRSVKWLIGTYDHMRKAYHSISPYSFVVSRKHMSTYFVQLLIAPQFDSTTKKCLFYVIVTYSIIAAKPLIMVVQQKIVAETSLLSF